LPREGLQKICLIEKKFKKNSFAKHNGRAVLQDFHKELVDRRKSVEKLLRNTAAEADNSVGETAPVTEGARKIATLQQKWNLLWRMSLDMKKKLQDNFANLLQVRLRRTTYVYCTYGWMVRV